MYRRAVSRCNARIEDPDSLILEEQRMMVGSSAKGVELLRPRVDLLNLR
jgi:hypothetical protein